MRSSSLLAVLALAAAGCGSHTAGAPFQVIAGDNVLAVSVDGSACPASAYLNEPCVSVKICVPRTTNCQTVSGLLLDTGSYGLRVFKEALPGPLLAALPPIPAPPPGGGTLAECVQYADLSADWGPVVGADVVLANEPPVTVPIQIIDASFATTAACPGAEPGPTAQNPTSFNGILGVGVFVQDCSNVTCPAVANMYFSWSGTSLTAVALDAPFQVQNPVGLLPLDNTGIIVVLPSVPSGGARSVDGAVVLGIGTRSNNQPINASALALDDKGEFTTTLLGTPMAGSFVDTGSNGLFFDSPSPIAQCTSQNAQGWYCPASALSLNATLGPSAGFPGNRLGAPFQVGNVEALLASGNGVFANVAGTGVQGGGFDWGLPFFLGRTVYLGIAGRSTAFGNGPTLAY
jgi:hypothetical protein